MGWLKRFFFGEKEQSDFLQKHYEMERKANKAASINGQHYTAYVGKIKQLKRERKHDEVIDLLIRIINAAEKEAEIKRAYGMDGWDVPPGYYRHLAIVYRKEKRYEDEIATIKRLKDQWDGHLDDKMAQRLEKARLVRDKQSV